MSLRIVTDVNAIDRKQWEKFVLDHPQGNVFQTPQMFAVYSTTKNYSPIVIACYKKNDLVGILLAVIQKEYKGILGKFSARSIIWGGPLVYSEDVAFEILAKYNENMRNKAVYSQIRSFSSIEPSIRMSFEKNGFVHENHLNILVDLTIGMDQFWRSIKKNRKDGINKAKRQGFEFETSNGLKYLEPFFNLLKQTYKNLKLPFPDKKFFLTLNSKLPENIKWFVLKQSSEPIIILCSLVFKGTIYAFYIGITKDNAILNLRPVDIFYYEVMCWGINNDFHTFDWMGAGRPDKEYGVRKFKLQYGGELIDMGRYEKIHKPVALRFSKIGFWFWQKLKR